MARWPFRFTLIVAVLLSILPSVQVTHAAPPLPVEVDLQGWLDAQPGMLKDYREGELSAAEIISGATSYYGLSPRILLALLEATNQLLSDPMPSFQALQQPFGAHGPLGFAEQIDWATRELRAGLGPYTNPPVVHFSDGLSLTLTLAQAPEGISVQRFLANGRTAAEWHAVVTKFGQAFADYFNNVIPEAAPAPQGTAHNGFLRRPWHAGTRVTHLAYFDHMYPTVDTGKADNGYMVNYLGQGGVQYDGHDGHDYYFPDKPIGTFILAAADGVAFASTHRGNGVWIQHDNGYVTVYWHLDRFARIFKGKVNTGRGVPVKAGDLLGSSGKTGFVVGSPHLHFEVRHNGKQVDPYGWFGDGPDPCSAYVACEPSVWLWHKSLEGEFDFTPPDAPAPPDTTPPEATITAAPRPDVLLYAPFDGSALQQVGRNAPQISNTPGFPEGQFGQGVRIASQAVVRYPTAGNVLTATGTIAFWAQLPEQYPASSTGRHYLIATSAHPDEGPVYTDTLALRREGGEQPRWNFWTTGATGEDSRDDLLVDDTLEPGWHHFAITWDSTTQRKVLYIDGAMAAQASNVTLPSEFGSALELGRWPQSSVASGVVYDDLVIFRRALSRAEVAALATTAAPFQASTTRVTSPTVQLDVNALDNAGGIMSVQLGINGQFGDPQPYQDTYTISLPNATGVYTVAARLFDRADNSTTVSTTLELIAPQFPSVQLENVTALSATLVFTPADDLAQTEVQLSHTPDFSNAPWQPLPTRRVWFWMPQNQVVWLRFRSIDGQIGPVLALGEDAQHLWIPMVTMGTMDD